MKIGFKFLAVSALLMCFSSLVFANSDRAFKRKRLSSNSNRVALVIGNGKYKSSPLRNARNDANDMARSLRQLGFTVILKLDANRRQMRKAIRKFGDKIHGGGVGLFFYAGHGMQVKGKNYLIPVGADIERENEIIDEGIEAASVLRTMEAAKNKVNIILLDACRNNPFARSFRSAGRGLAKMDALNGSFIVYATAPGSVASDGSGRNGVFTKHLLKNLQTPNLEISKMMRNVRKGVFRETNKKQTPWQASSLFEDFFFKKTSKPAITNNQNNQITQEKYQLSLKVRPYGAKVRLTNKSYSFENGMELPSGVYRFKVSKEGYYSKGFSVQMRRQDRTVDIRLREKPRVETPTHRGMVLIPAGRFTMGSNNGRSNEKPVHQVTLRAYYIDKYEVTVNQYRKCVNAGKCKRPKTGSYLNWNESGRGNHPINGVSWFNATNYCKFAGKKLPTEAQWEKAATWKNGRKYKYPSGKDNISCSDAVMNDGNKYGGSRSYGCGKVRTWPVGSKIKEINGTYDMAGNVWEWTSDWYGSYSSSHAYNPTGKSKGSYRVNRGGSWSSSDRSYFRGAFRNSSIPTNRGSSVGFRCAVASP